MKNPVFQILETIEQTQGSNAKQAILLSHKDNDLLKEIFQLTFDPYTNFYVAKVPKVKRIKNSNNDFDDSNAIALMSAIKSCISKEFRGNAARDVVAKTLEQMTDIEFKWASRIITRKLRSGIGESGIDATWPGLVPSFEVSLANKVDWVIENNKLIIQTPLSYPCRVEPKWDGFRCVAVKIDNEVTLYARSGRVFDRAPTIKAFLDAHMPNETIFDGEIISSTWNATSEILGSRVNHKSDESLNYFVFDILPLEIWKTQNDSESLTKRLIELTDVVDSMPDGPVKLAEGKKINNEIELLEYYELCLKRDYEGVMIKKYDASYAFKRNDNVLKLKPITDYDCVVTGIAEAREQTKWDGMHTILVVTLPNTNFALTRVGSGTNDAEKIMIDEQRGKLIGRPCTIQGQPPLSEDNKIRFPRFLKWREEWDCAPEVIKLIKEVKGI